MRKNIFKISIALVITVMFCSVSSCSDVTNISKAQLKEHITKHDDPGSKIINKDQQPILVLNNKIISFKFLHRIKIKYIESISVLKGDSAVKLYGKSGKNNVIKIHADKKVFTDLKPDTTSK